jgi:hypothetical protein
MFKARVVVSFNVVKKDEGNVSVVASSISLIEAPIVLNISNKPWIAGSPEKFLVKLLEF